MSIILKATTCPSCGGPLGPMAASLVACPFCDTQLYIAPKAGFRIPPENAYPHPPGVAVVSVGNVSYRVHGRLARGEHSDVFLARRERALTRMVVLKVALDGGEAAMRSEWETLHTLRTENDYLGRLNSAPIALASGACPGRHDRLTAVYSWRSGFVHTMEDARAEYPDGVDPRAAVWMWNRLLDQTACLHDAGWSHNALRPEHVLIHARDHGLALCGWSQARRQERSDDLEQGAVSIAYLLGKTAPPALRDLTREACRFGCALELKTKLGKVSEAAFGPPRFHTFILQGDKHGIR